MKTVERFTSFKGLKSSKKKDVDDKSQLKRHLDFEKLMKEIRAARIKKSEHSKTQ